MANDDTSSPAAFRAGQEFRSGWIIFLLTSILGATLYFGWSGPTRTKWEYSVAAVKDDNFDKDMRKLGDAGWEVVSARRASDGSTYSPTFSYELIIKRPQSLFDAPRP